MSTDRPHFKFWPTRVPRTFTVPRSSLWHNLRVSAERYPDKPALVFLNRITTYSELAAQVEAMAGALHALGVARGDRVLLLAQNTAQLVIAHFAILRANAVVVPVNPMNRAKELGHYIADSGARVAITTGDLAHELASSSNELDPQHQLHHLVVTQFNDAFDTSVIDSPAVAPSWQAWLSTVHVLPSLAAGQVHAWTELMAARHAGPEHMVGADDMALLPYTSGTTGAPKGCVHHHSSLMHNAVASALWGQAQADQVVLAVVPMFHIVGIVTVLHTAIYCGAQLVLMPRWDREVAADLIQRWRVTNWANIPTMVMDLLASPNAANFDLSSLKSIGGGGTAMPQVIAQRLWDQYELRYQEGYGLTETCAPTHANPPDRPKQQCLGIPYPNTDARVVNPETFAEQPVGEIGEIIMRGPQLFQGYWGRPEDTAAAWVDFDGMRYFRSGDMGFMDAEGYFFLTDRLKRMINASGFKVWPAEVEMLMLKHPAVQEACVIATKDTYRGQSVKALVVRRPGSVGVKEADIVAWCRQEMAVYKVPRLVQFVDSLPKSGSGKVMWRQLQDHERGESS